MARLSGFISSSPSFSSSVVSIANYGDAFSMHLPNADDDLLSLFRFYVKIYLCFAISWAVSAYAGICVPWNVWSAWRGKILYKWIMLVTLPTWLLHWHQSSAFCVFNVCMLVCCLSSRYLRATKLLWYQSFLESNVISHKIIASFICLWFIMLNKFFVTQNVISE